MVKHDEGGDGSDLDKEGEDEDVIIRDPKSEDEREDDLEPLHAYNTRGDLNCIIRVHGGLVGLFWTPWRKRV